MEKNRIEGRHGAMSWHNTAKSSGMPVEVNAVAARWSQNEIVRYALNNRWLEEQGVPDMNAPAAVAARKPYEAKPHGWRHGVKAIWIILHYGAKAPS
jgi:hypothetical protein